MKEDEIAKLLLQDCNCQGCKTLNPYEWPTIWCRYSPEEPEEHVCERYDPLPEINIKLKSYKFGK